MTDAASPVRVLLADAHRSFVDALSTLLNSNPGVQVVAQVSRSGDMLRAVHSQVVDVAVLTVDGPEDAIAVAPAMLEARPQLKLVAVAELEDVGLLVRAVREGFRAWVPKSGDVAALVEVVAAVVRDETRIPPAMLTRLLAQLLRSRDEQHAAAALLAALTGREREVLWAMVAGSTRQEIAEELEISENTVRTHLQHILGKLGVHTSLAAVTLARRAIQD
jgi:DNA-binding NarL/FixJ family response regulator